MVFSILCRRPLWGALHTHTLQSGCVRSTLSCGSCMRLCGPQVLLPHRPLCLGSFFFLAVPACHEHPLKGTLNSGDGVQTLTEAFLTIPADCEGGGSGGAEPAALLCEICSAEVSAPGLALLGIWHQRFGPPWITGSPIQAEGE